MSLGLGGSAPALVVEARDRGCYAAGPGVVVVKVGEGSRGGATAHAAGASVATHAASAGGATHAASATTAARVPALVLPPMWPMLVPALLLEVSVSV
jgi:hypothetical protein